MHSLRTSETDGFWSCFKYKSQHLLSSQRHLHCEIAGLARAELTVQPRRLQPERKQQDVSGVRDHTHLALRLRGDVSIAG